MIFYKQQRKTSCLLDVLGTVLQKNPQKIRKQHKRLIDFFKFNYLKYSSFLKILHKEGFGVKFAYSEIHAWNTAINKNWNGFYILGVNLAKDDFVKPLHAVVFYNGKVWEPYGGKFLDINELKIVYAFCVDKKFKTEDSVIEYCSKWDEGVSRSGIKGRDGYHVDKNGTFKYLEVIGEWWI